MGGVGKTDQKTATYRLYLKSKYCFCLRIFIDLLDFSHVISHIVYMELGNDISLMNFKVFVVNTLIGSWGNCKR